MQNIFVQLLGDPALERWCVTKPGLEWVGQMSFLVILSAAVHMYYGRMLMSYEGSFCSFPFSRLLQNRETFLLSLPCSWLSFFSGFFSLLGFFLFVFLFCFSPEWSFYTAAGRSAVSHSCAPWSLTGVSWCSSGRGSGANLVCTSWRWAITLELQEEPGHTACLACHLQVC